MVLPRDLLMRLPSVPGKRANLVTSASGSGKTSPKMVVEAARHLAGQLQVRQLVLAHGHGVGPVDEDVGGLQHRVAQVAVADLAAQVQVADLLLEGRVALQAAHADQHATAAGRARRAP